MLVLKSQYYFVIFKVILQSNITKYLPLTKTHKNNRSLAPNQEETKNGENNNFCATESVFVKRKKKIKEKKEKMACDKHRLFFLFQRQNWGCNKTKLAKYSIIG